MTHEKLCLSFEVPALGSSTHYACQLRSAGQTFQAAGPEHLPTGNYLSSQKLFREHKQSLSARFPRRNTARSTPFLAVAATSERYHCTVSHPVVGISPVTGETLTRERSCTCSRPSQHTQGLPRSCFICRSALQTTIAHSPEGIHCEREDFEVIHDVCRKPAQAVNPCHSKSIESDILVGMNEAV